MLCFIIALKSKAASNNWERVSTLFENSLLSAYNQIDPNFKIIVVCHEIPKLKYNYDHRVEIISVVFSPPTSKAATNLTMQDKWKKLAVGMVRAGELKPHFIMIMDADDLVSRKLAQYANNNLTANGWIFKQGYRYRYGSRWIYWDNFFNCGTNAIVSSRLIKFPLNTHSESIAECVVLSHGHTVIQKCLEELGTPLVPLPFPGAVYVYGHGDNYSDTHYPKKMLPSYNLRYFLGRIRRTRYLNQKIREEFSINS